MGEDPFSGQRRGVLDKGFEAVQSKAKFSGLRERATFTETGNQEHRPLLTHIAPEAGMGGLMYEMRSSRLLKTIRRAEKTIYEAFAKKGVSPSAEVTSIPEKKKTTAEVAFMNFCLTHREGHIEGLKKVPQKDLLTAVLANAEGRTDINGKDLALQAAVTFEVSRDDENTKAELRSILTESPVWKSQVLDAGVTQGLPIPGLHHTEGALFPGATTSILPTKEKTLLDEKLSPLLEKWRGFVASSTEQRAKNFIADSQPLQVASSLKQVTTSA